MTKTKTAKAKAAQTRADVAMKPKKQPKKRAPRKEARAGQGKQAQVAAAYATGQKTGQAQIYRNGVDSCRIVHRELIASITGSTAFTVAAALSLNPGLAATFPWLSNEAEGWEKYRFNKLRFCYYTRTGSNVPGSFMLAPDYDASDAAPVSEVAASAYEDTEEDAPWKDICCILRVDEMHGDMKEKFIRSGALPANQDVKTYDVGTMFACTVDGTAVSWGKLWVEYDVTLITPHVPPGGFSQTGTLSGAGGGLAAAPPFGAAPAALGSPILSCPALVLTMSNLVVGQEYGLALDLVGSAITVCTASATSGLTQVTGPYTTVVNAAGTAAHIFATYTATATTGTVTLVVTATTVTQSKLFVSVLAPVPAF